MYQLIGIFCQKIIHGSNIHFLKLSSTLHKLYLRGLDFEGLTIAGLKKKSTKLLKLSKNVSKIQTEKL